MNTKPDISGAGKTVHGHGRKGFSLVEVVLALGVASFSLLTILGLLTVALNANQSSIQQTAANGFLSAVAADLRAAGSKASTSRQFSIPIPTDPNAPETPQTQRYLTSEGRVSEALSSESRYLLTVHFLSSGSTAPSATLVKIQISWPAAVSDPAKAYGSVQTLVALDRN